VIVKLVEFSEYKIQIRVRKASHLIIYFIMIG